MFDIIGDPHLGRGFVTGVPLERRGEREKLVFDDFCNRMLNPIHSTLIVMGDLFDTTTVSNTLLYRTALIIRTAARTNRSTVYYILAGNHDLCKDNEKMSSFDILEDMVNEDNVVFVSDTAECYHAAGTDIILVPFSYTASPEEQIQRVFDNTPFVNNPIVFGHWDVDGNGGYQFPHAFLRAKGITKAYTGHIHLPGERVYGDLKLTLTGSMQPYAHGEDATEKWYLTRTLEQVQTTDPGFFHNKNLRIVLKPGQVFDDKIDCLSLRIVVENEIEDDGDLPTTSFGEFNLRNLLTQALDESAVPVKYQTLVLEKLSNFGA